MRRTLTLAAAAAALGMMAFAPSALGRETFIVDDDGEDCPNAQFTSIQLAVAAAPPGSKILVCRGQYHEQVNVWTPAKSNLRIMAKHRPEEVILEGDNARQHGFFLQDVSGVLVDGFTVRQYLEDIHLQRTTHSTIRRNRTTEASVHDGIVLRDSHHNIVEHNESFLNTKPISCGISLSQNASFNTVRHNLTYGNTFAGINLSPLPFFLPVLPAGPGNAIEHNVARENPGHGIRNIDTPDTRIEHNRVVDNRQDGIHVQRDRSTGLIVEHNHVSGNTEQGIHVLNAPRNTIAYNITEDNVLDGLFLENADNHTVENNHSRDNRRDGLRADSSSALNLIESNHMRRNAEHDCHDDSVGPGTGGTANFWISDKGETENRPGLCKKAEVVP